MKRLLSKWNIEIFAAIGVFAAGWIVLMAGNFFLGGGWKIILPGSLLMAAGLLLLYNSCCALEPFKGRMGKVRLAVLLFVGGWVAVMVGGFYDLGGWALVILANLFMVGGLYALILSGYDDEKAPSPGSGAVLLALGFSLALAAGGCGAPQENPSGFHLPQGNAAAGKEALRALKCYVCHAVPGEGFPAPHAQPPVDIPLGFLQSGQSRERLAESILAPSHRIAPGILLEDKGLSRMGDFSEAMSVRQLIDLTAYLKSLAEK
jgi:hypothetical protein